MRNTDKLVLNFKFGIFKNISPLVLSDNKLRDLLQGEEKHIYFTSIYDNLNLILTGVN